MASPLLELTERGLHCQLGDFYIDPWLPVRRAVITHAHGDHLAAGCGEYWLAEDGLAIARLRLGEQEQIQPLAYGQTIVMGRAAISLHPAGHVLGSAQVRVEVAGAVWVVTGDFKREPDPTCAPFEVIPCDGLVIESTFALPIYRWPPAAETLASIASWWENNRENGFASLLFVYPFGKAQRVLATLPNPEAAPILTHGAVERLNNAYRMSGVSLPNTIHAANASKAQIRQAIVFAPLSARASPWIRRFGEHRSGFVSGWMRIRGARRRRAVDRGFVLSDHADWTALLATIRETGADTVWTTHGYRDVLARWLVEAGLNARSLPSQRQPAQPEDLTLPFEENDEIGRGNGTFNRSE